MIAFYCLSSWEESLRKDELSFNSFILWTKKLGNQKGILV